MKMSYTKNPHMPKVRQDTARLVYRGWGVRKVARYVGVSPGTVTKWVKKAKVYGYHPIPTLSSKPKHHPKQLSDELVWKIFHKRLLIKRSAEVVQQELIN
jgi:transposase